MNNVETIHAIYADFGRGDIAGILSRLSEDIDWEYAYPDRGVPWLRPGRGRGHVGTFFQALGGVRFEHFKVNAVIGEGRLVVGLVDVAFVVASTGKRVQERDEVHLWFFDERGQIARFRHAVDTVQHVEACQP